MFNAEMLRSATVMQLPDKMKKDEETPVFLNHWTITAATFSLSSSERTCRRQIVEAEQCLHKQRLSPHSCQEAEAWYPA